MDTNNQDMNAQDPVAISPDQTTMFDDGAETTTMHIPHSDAVIVESGHEKETETISSHDEAVPNSTKVKIFAALAIVAVAGYAAYWVQEPVQLRADVLNSESTSTDSASTENLVTDTKTVAEAPMIETLDAAASVSVDVSLFGFEPAVLKVDKGVTVVWTNTSTEDQTIIGSSESGESFASPVLTSGQSFNYKFDQDGTFEYYSTYNPALKATITVGLGQAEVASVETTTTAEPVVVSESTDTTTTNTDTLFGSAAPETVTSENNAAMSALENTKTEASTKDTSELKPAATTPGKLAKTGPAETMYAVVLGIIAWFNRKKLVKVFKN